MIELEPETMTAAPRTRAGWGEVPEIFPERETRRQSNPPAPVQIETPETLFVRAVDAINKRFKPGTLEYIEGHAPELAEDIRRALDRLNQVWAGWIPGADLAPFKLALRTYYNLIIRAVDLFEDSTNGKKTE